MNSCSFSVDRLSLEMCELGGGGGGGKALTMTITPWNLPHGQWSKKMTMTMTPSILAMVMVKNGQFWPFDHDNFVILAMVMVKNGQY